MRAWIFSLVGIVFVGVMLDIILPEGKTNSFIKHIFSILLLFVIISPVANLVKCGNIFNSSNNNVIDSNFIYETNLKKVEALENDIEKALLNNKIKNSSVIISANIFEEVLIVQKVYVDLASAEIDKSIKDIKSLVVKIVTGIINVNENEVWLYGE